MSKNSIYALISIIVVVGLVVGVWRLRQHNALSSTTSSVTPTPTISPTVVQGGQQMQSEDIVVGTGDEAVAGKSVTVTYVGTLTDGTKFDASADHTGSFTFTLGAGRVIEGWDKGVVGMKVGGKRKLTIPPDMGYGSQANGSIPANSTLIFDIELLKVE